MNLLRIFDKYFRISNCDEFIVNFSNKEEYDMFLSICRKNYINWASGIQTIERDEDNYDTISRGYRVGVSRNFMTVRLIITGKSLYSVKFSQILKNLEISIPNSFKEI